MRAQFVLQEVWTGLRRNLTMTVALVVVVAISLSLLGTGLLFVKQVDDTRTYWQGKVQLSIYLCTTTSVSPQCQAERPRHPGGEDPDRLGPAPAAPGAARLLRVPGAGVPHFKQDFSRDPQFTSLVTKSEIPDSFQVKLVNTQADYSIVAGTVQGRPGVDQVVDDASILSKFYALLDGARNAVVIIAIILIIAAVLLVANTIRLSAFNRRRETSIMRLVGASNFYVQLPFLVEGDPRRAGRLADRGRAADRRQDAGTGLAAAVLPLQRGAVRGRPHRGHRAGHGDGGAPVRSHLLPHAAALSAGVKARRRLAAAAAGAKERTVIARNRRARHDYHIEDVVEAGLVLTGTEVKSLRAGRASLTDGFAQISDGEMWLHGVHIPEYAQGTWTNHEPRRPRKLLLHRKEIDKLASNIAERGLHSCAALAVLLRREGEGRTGAGPRQADLR